MQLQVPRPVGPQLQDAHARPADGGADRGVQCRDVVHEPVLPAQRCHHRPDIDPMRRPEQLLVVLWETRAGHGGRGLGLGQEREDAAPVVVDEDDRCRQAVQARRDQGVEVVEEGDVAHDQGDGATGHRGRPKGRRHDPVDAVGAPVRADRDRTIRGRKPGVQVADRHGA